MVNTQGEPPMVAVGVPLALLAVRELRRLPDTPAGTPVWSVPTGG